MENWVENQRKVESFPRNLTLFHFIDLHFWNFSGDFYWVSLEWGTTLNVVPLQAIAAIRCREMRTWNFFPFVVYASTNRKPPRPPPPPPHLDKQTLFCWQFSTPNILQIEFPPSQWMKQWKILPRRRKFCWKVFWKQILLKTQTNEQSNCCCAMILRDTCYYTRKRFCWRFQRDIITVNVKLSRRKHLETLKFESDRKILIGKCNLRWKSLLSRIVKRNIT